MAPIASIIKYEGDNSTFIWKHPCEDFNSMTQLVVHESQEAIFFMNGQALDLFGPGRYTLETENIPILRHLINIPTGGVSAFHCEVYFINKTEQMAIRWGTDSKVQYVEPTYKFPLSIGASGEMSLCVDDSRKLLVKLVGTERIARNAPDLYGALIATGIFAHIALQVTLNIAVVTGLMPTTGVTLPFISYGGTAIVILLAEMRIALGISSKIRLK